MPTDFDSRAEAYDDDPDRVERARAAAAALRAALPLRGSTRLLEYGAGTGLVSQALAPRIGELTLAEPSQGMRSVLARKVAAHELPATTRIWDLDLTTTPPPDERFDVVITVMTLHHISDLAPVLSGFARLLTDGGMLAVVDLEEEDGSFHDDDHDFDGHRGFARATLAAQLGQAGFDDLRFEPCYTIEKDLRTYPLFLMVGARTATGQREG